MVFKAREFYSLLIMIEKRRFFILLLIKKRRILLASLPAGFYAFPIILNMSSANRTLLNSTELSCDILFSICLLFCLKVHLGLQYQLVLPLRYQPFCLMQKRSLLINGTQKHIKSTKSLARFVLFVYLCTK